MQTARQINNVQIKTVKAGQPLIDFIKLCIAADTPPLLIGGPGVGKSEVLEQAAAECKLGFISRDLSLMEPPDLVGIPQVVKGRTVYRPPSWLPHKGGRGGLLVFEELNRCAQYVRAPCLQLLTARTLNDYKLPVNWLIAAALNPHGESYETFELDLAHTSRYVLVDVVADVNEWLRWAKDNKIHQNVVQYVQANPEVFNEPHSNPRAWTRVSKLLHAYDRGGLRHATLEASTAGCVGVPYARSFLEFCQDPVRPLSAEQVLQSYERHYRKAFKKAIATGRLDLTKATLTNILSHLQVPDHYEQSRGKRTWWRNLGLFLGDIPPDQRERAREDFEDRHDTGGKQYTFPRRPRGRPREK